MLEFAEFQSRCAALFKALDENGEEVENLASEVETKLAQEIRDQVSYLICDRVIGGSTGYYTIYYLAWDEKHPTFLVDYRPTEETMLLTGSVDGETEYYYFYIKVYPPHDVPKRIRYVDARAKRAYSIVYQIRERFKVSMGRSGLDERELYENIIAAARIAKSASRFVVPIQNPNGRVVSMIEIGYEDVIFIEVLREILRRRMVRDAEERELR